MFLLERWLERCKLRQILKMNMHYLENSKASETLWFKETVIEKLIITSIDLKKNMLIDNIIKNIKNTTNEQVPATIELLIDDL